jgi:hypothetical protein
LQINSFIGKLWSGKINISQYDGEKNIECRKKYGILEMGFKN